MQENIANDLQKKNIGYYIFRASRKNPKTGQIEYAKDYGKKAFKIWISKKQYS